MNIVFGCLCTITQGIHMSIEPQVRAALYSGQLNLGHRCLKHWVGIKWKYMHARDRERERQRQKRREADWSIHSEANEYSTWWQWVPKHHQPPHLVIPQRFHLKQFSRLPSEKKGISWSRYTSFFLQWVTDPLKPFQAASHWLTHLFYLPSAIHYVCCQWKAILLSLNSFLFCIY